MLFSHTNLYILLIIVFLPYLYCIFIILKNIYKNKNKHSMPHWNLLKILMISKYSILCGLDEVTK